MFLHTIISWLARKLEKKGIVEDMKEFNDTRLPEILGSLKSTLQVGRGGITFHHHLSEDGKRCYITPRLTSVNLREGAGVSPIVGGRVIVHDPKISEEKLLKKMAVNVGDLMLHEYLETLYYRGDRVLDPHEKYEISTSASFWKRRKKNEEQEKKKEGCSCGASNGMLHYAYKHGGLRLGILVLLTVPLWYPFYWVMPKRHAPDCKL